jgi:hypothetical protein
MISLVRAANRKTTTLDLLGATAQAVQRAKDGARVERGALAEITLSVADRWLQAVKPAFSGSREKVLPLSARQSENHPRCGGTAHHDRFLLNCDPTRGRWDLSCEIPRVDTILCRPGD